jgi:hypothetical protein
VPPIVDEARLSTPKFAASVMARMDLGSAPQRRRLPVPTALGARQLQQRRGDEPGPHCCAEMRHGMIACAAIKTHSDCCRFALVSDLRITISITPSVEGDFVWRKGGQSDSMIFTCS